MVLHSHHHCLLIPMPDVLQHVTGIDQFGVIGDCQSMHIVGTEARRQHAIIIPQFRDHLITRIRRQLRVYMDNDVVDIDVHFDLLHRVPVVCGERMEKISLHWFPVQSSCSLVIILAPISDRAVEGPVS